MAPMKAMKKAVIAKPVKKSMKAKKQPRAPMRGNQKLDPAQEPTKAVAAKTELCKSLKREQSKFLGWAKYNADKDTSVGRALEVALTN